MDKKSYFEKANLEKIPIGSIVQIKINNFTNMPTVHMGVVVNFDSQNNKTLFPSVRVYNLDTKRITTEFIGSLKIISKANE